LKQPNETRYASQVTQEIVSWLDLLNRFPTTLPKSRDLAARLKEFLPCCASEKIEPVIGLFHVSLQAMSPRTSALTQYKFTPLRPKREAPGTFSGRYSPT
jgi:hypothetical protein